MASMEIAGAGCPLPLERLGQLYRADPEAAHEMLEDLSEVQRVDFALFCYGRSHLRGLGLTVAATCDAAKLARRAGTLGAVLATQCRQARTPRAKISLGGTRHALPA